MQVGAEKRDVRAHVSPYAPAAGGSATPSEARADAQSENKTRPHAELIGRLAPKGIPRTDFFTAVRLLEHVTPQSPRVGGEGPLSAETIAFRHSPSFASQPNELESIKEVEVLRTTDQALEARRKRFEVTTCFLGLSGADSPLPLYHAADMVHDDEWSRRQVHFLDIFHNRMTALFFRAVSKYDYPRECTKAADDPGTTRALALAGLDVAGQEDQAVSRRELMQLAALTAMGGSTARSIENGLRALLRRDLGDIPLKLAQFTGGWVRYDESQTNRLGQANNEAGVSFMLGTRIRHPAHRSRITIGPMPPDKAREFSPGGRSYGRIMQLVDALCGEPLVFDLELLVRQSAYPPFVLGKRRMGKDICLTGRRDSGRIVSRVYELDASNTSNTSKTSATRSSVSTSGAMSGQGQGKG